MRRKIWQCSASVVAAAVLATFSLTTAVPASAAAVNNQTDRIVVLDNNLENRTAGCGYDFTWLATHMSSYTYLPDVFTVQQVANQTDLTNLLTYLKNTWGKEYAGAIAIPTPTSANNMYPTAAAGSCQYQKRFQTNAVIWRKERFNKLGQATWNSDAKYGSGSCANLMDVNPKQARTKNIAVALQDTLAKRTVVVASIHWPTNKPDGDPTRDSHSCAAENFSEANQAADNLASTYRYANYSNAPAPARIIGGDTNAKTSIDGWWQNAKNAGYRDPIAEKCGQTTGANYSVCLSQKTAENNRLDFILVEHGGGFTASASETIQVPTGGTPYSNHLAVRAMVHY